MTTKVPTTQLGKNGPQVAKLGLGLMGLSRAYTAKPPPDEERLPVLDRAFELGCTNWDTADRYGDNEDFVGKWFKRTGKRKEVFLATKFATVLRADGSHTPAFTNRPSYVREACESSLRRLGTDYIDLYYCHRVTGEYPIEDVVEAMAELVKEGKVKYLGLSECSATTLRRACKIHHIAAVQMEYSPWTMDIEYPQHEFLSTCRELGVAVVAYSPLGRGFLTGQYKSPADFEEGDVRISHPRFSAENFPKNLALVEKFRAIAAKKGCTTGQLTLAWLMAQGNDIIPIPGTKKIKYLEENLGAVDVHISEAEDAELRRAIGDAEISGHRYPDFMIPFLFTETPERK